jgi:hypothetical protein
VNAELRGLHYQVTDFYLRTRCGWDLEDWPCEAIRRALADELRPPETDEETWSVALPDPDAGIDLLDGANVATAVYLSALALVAGALVMTIAALGIRRALR